MHARDLAAASSHVHLSGWHFSPTSRSRLEAGRAPQPARRALGACRRACTRVGAAPATALPADAGHRPEGHGRACRGTRVRYALDTRERPMHCHHEKTIEIDDRVAYVGGIDLSLEGGDRFDSHHHIARATLGWHDVATRLEGPAVADVAAHFRMRWGEVTGDVLQPGPTPQATGGSTVQVVRTVPGARSAVPRGEFRILENANTSVRGRRGRSSTWRTSSSGRPRSRQVGARSCAGRLRTSARCSPATKPNTGAGRPRAEMLVRADRCRRRRRAAARLHGLCATRRAQRPRCTSTRKPGHRRRVAHDRLCEPQRALALQRHRDERRLSRGRRRPRDTPAPVGRAPRTRRGRPRRSARRDRGSLLEADLTRATRAPEGRASTTHRLVELPAFDRTERLLGALQRLLVDG